jgi:18S rRNA (guanine1575-N7)-methyltransferase
MARPEHVAPADVFYSAAEAGKYTSNSRVMAIQAEMAARCIELLNFPAGARRLVLDVGCGSGLSGDALIAAGHEWLGLDVAEPMLLVAAERGCGSGGGAGGDLVLGDMGQGFGLRAGTFDGAISVSALQWLCYSDRAGHRAARRLTAFFGALYRALRRGARAALQFYPESPAQIELITAAAHRAGFSGGLVVDNPESKKTKKYYLVVFAGSDAAVTNLGGADADAAAAAEEEEDDDEEYGEEEEEEDMEGGGGGGGGGARSAAGGARRRDDDGLTAGGGTLGGRRSTAGAGAGASVGGGGRVPMEQRRGEGGAGAGGEAKAEKAARRRARDAARPPKAKSRAWILAKKDAARRRGKDDVRPDSKYSGRRRGPKF